MPTHAPERYDQVVTAGKFASVKDPVAATICSRASVDVGVLLGIVPWTPVLRQSLIKTLQSCPRRFLFQHRMRLRRRHRPRSSALDIGTFVHVLLANYYAGLQESPGVYACGKLIEERMKKVEKDFEDPVVRMLQSPDDVRSSMESDLALARAMVRSYRAFCPLNEDYETVAVEQGIRIQQRGIRRHITGRVDRVTIHRPTGEIHIWDPKTCSEAPKVRARKCPVELQVRMYRPLVEALAKERWPGQPVVGMIHPLLQKPGIRFCSEDRPFEWIKHTLKSGPRKGQVEMRKEWLSSIPDFGYFCERVLRWYAGTHEFEKLGVQRVADASPPILESWIAFTGPSINAELFVIFHEASRACLTRPKLHRFPRHDASCIVNGRECPYLEFCRRPVGEWRNTREEFYDVAPPDGDSKSL